jgi:enoyl-CoA hydratase
MRHPILTKHDGKAPLQIETDNGVGTIVLDRPKSLNALSPAMVAALGGVLRQWRDDPAVRRVILRGAGDRAFSAGADVRAIWAFVKEGKHDVVLDYFAEEYAIDLMLSDYPKDCLAVVDGICFGGGMGLAVHSRLCLATESASFSMPETLIGFFPDAGASHFLSRLPGGIGLYLGMTGERLSGADAVRLGLASHYVLRDNLPRAVEAFIAEGEAALAEFVAPLPPDPLAEFRAEIDHCFGAATVDEILERLAQSESEWARRTLAVLRQRSPSSLRWTKESQEAGRGRDLAACLADELKLVGVSTAHPDFAEGVRAALIDKDKTPRWAQLSRRLTGLKAYAA